MDPRVSFITLAVPDLEAERAFYVDGLGWEPAMHVPDDVLMIQVGDKLLLSLWVEAAFEDEVGAIRRGTGLAPITLAHNLPERDQVDGVLEDARAAGAAYVRDGTGAGVGRLHRVLRGPGRLPLGGRLEPRTHRPDRPPVTDHPRSRA